MAPKFRLTIIVTDPNSTSPNRGKNIIAQLSAHRVKRYLCKCLLGYLADGLGFPRLLESPRYSGQHSSLNSNGHNTFSPLLINYLLQVNEQNEQVNKQQALILEQLSMLHYLLRIRQESRIIPLLFRIRLGTEF